MVPPKNGVLRLWVPQLGQAAVAAADGLPEVLAVAAIPAATLDGLLAWFVVQSSRNGIKRAAKKRLQVSFCQTMIRTRVRVRESGIQLHVRQQLMGWGIY